MRYTSRTLSVVGLTLLIGLGTLATAWQFNDGKINQAVVGTIFIGMGMPNLFIAGIMRLFGHRIGLYFLGVGLFCLLVGILLLAFR